VTHGQPCIMDEAPVQRDWRGYTAHVTEKNRQLYLCLRPPAPEPSPMVMALQNELAFVRKELHLRDLQLAQLTEYNRLLEHQYRQYIQVTRQRLATYAPEPPYPIVSSPVRIHLLNQDQT